jgi:hypothetical protein
MGSAGGFNQKIETVFRLNNRPAVGFFVFRSKECYGVNLYLSMVICVLVLLIVVLSYCPLYAQNRIKITEPNWNILLDKERKTLSDKFVVEVVSGASVGVILDVQMLDASSPGSNAGSQLGAAYGSAAYIDHAFKKPGHYSAVSDLNATLAGAFLGGLLADSKPQSKFITRYALKTLDGGIRYFDEVKENPFRQPVGICVSTIDMSPVDQGLCSQTTEQIRSLYLVKETSTGYSTTDDNKYSKEGEDKVISQIKKTNGKEKDKVRCKFGTSMPILIDRETCIKAQGEILNEK